MRQILPTGDAEWPWKIVWGNGVSRIDSWCFDYLSPHSYQGIAGGWKFKNFEDAQALMLAWYE